MIQIPKLYKEWGIYKIENLINGKVYIGSSSVLYYRLCRHLNTLRKNTHPNKHLQSAWNIYNESNFSITILEITIKDKDFLLNREDFYLSHYKSYLRENGYNIFEKGTSGKGFKWTEEARKGIIGRGKGRKSSEETKKKISDSHIGKKATVQAINKMIESKQVPIIMMNLDGSYIKEWKSAKDASLWLGITPSAHISNVLNGKLKSCKNYIFVRKSEYDQNKDYSINKGKRMKVLQLSLDNKILHEFSSLSEAALETKDSTSSISKCCRGIKKISKGFIWKYKNE